VRDIPHPGLRADNISSGASRYFLRAIILGVLLVTAAGGCNCNGGSDTDIDPSDAKPSDLYGWWTHTDAQSGTVTVFGFIPQADAARVLPIKPEEITGDISAVYQGDLRFQTDPVQLATFDVKDGELLQTVIRATSAPPGTQFRTRIVSLKGQLQLELQSTNSTTGSRSFSFSARCPAEQPNGTFNMPGQVCNNYFSAATSLAVDGQGNVHAASAVLGRVEPGACPAGKAAVPTYSHFADACGPSLNPLPNFRASDMVTDESTVHFAYMSQSAELAKDFLLFYRSRPLDQRGDWIEEQVAPQGYPIHEMRLLLRNGQPHLLVSRTSGVIELFRRDGGTWTLVPTPLTSGPPLEGRMADATLDREGKLVLLLESSHQVAYERAAGFELIPLPKEGMAAGFGGGIAADSEGRVHVVYNWDEIGDNPSGIGGRVVNGRGIYGLYDGTAWTSHELGPMAYPRIVTRADGPWSVVHAIAKAAQPTLVLTEVSRDGSLRSELLSLEPNFGGGASPEPFYHPTAAVGPDGTIAAAWDGNRVYIRPPEAQIVRERTTLTVQIEGRGHGRVRSADGTIDCTATCTVEVPVGLRYQLFFEPDGQSARDQVTCAPSYFNLYGYCWVDVFPGQAPTVTAKFRESPVASLLPVSIADSRATVKRLAARGGRVAIVVPILDGKLHMGESEVDVGTAQQVLGVREADGRVWAVELPMEPEAIGFKSDGSISALFLANRGLSFPSGTVGSFETPVLLLAHYANGSFQRVARIVDLPQGTTLAVGAAAVGDDGAVGAVLSNFSSFSSLGIPEYTLFAYGSAAGTVSLVGRNETQTITQFGTVSLAAGRAAVTLNNQFLLFFDGGTHVSTRTVADVAVTSIGGVTQTADRVLSLWATLHNTIDLGGGPMPRQANGLFYAEYGLDGRYLSAKELAHAQTASYLVPAPSGTIFAGQSTRGGLTYGRVMDTGYLFTYAGELTGNKATPFLAAFDTEANRFWIAVKHQGTVDYDVATLTEPYRQVLLELRLP